MSSTKNMLKFVLISLFILGLSTVVGILTLQFDMKVKCKDIYEKALDTSGIENIYIGVQEHSTCKDINELYQNKSLESIIIPQVKFTKEIYEYYYFKRDDANKFQAIESVKPQIKELALEVARTLDTHVSNYHTNNNE